MKKITQRLLFSLIVLLIVLGLAELVLRLTGVAVQSGEVVNADRWLYHAVERAPWSWDEYITVGARVYPLDSGNYNIDRPVELKRLGVTRIFCLGDSSTVGLLVRPDQPYPQVLQRVLPACYPQKTVEVWNLGRWGYTSYQGRLLLEKYWALWPDVVTFYFGVNDQNFAPLREDKAWDTMPRWSLDLHRTLYRSSALYRLVRNVNLHYLRSKVSHPLGGGNLQKDARLRVSPADYLANRAALEQRLAASGGKLIFMRYAMKSGDSVTFAPYYLRAPLRPGDIDAVALFADSLKAGRNPLADDVHPNPLGHRLLARAIFDRLAALWGPPECDPDQVFAAEAARP